MASWLPMFLKPIQEEYTKAPVSFRQVVPTKKDIQYVVQRGLEEDRFDVLNLRRNLTTSLQKGNAILNKYSSSLGNIFIVSPKEAPWTDPPLSLWSRAIRALSPKSPVRIVIYASLLKRLPPPIGTPIGPEHINGGFTNHCDPGSIIIYRREEATRVLVHELFHANCSDPHTEHIPVLEGDTEAWAELFLCGLEARGVKEKFLDLFESQMRYAVKQAYSCQKYHGVNSLKDYAWRYLFGRIVVWKRLGFDVPDIVPVNLEPPKTLRLTYESLTKN